MDDLLKTGYKMIYMSNTKLLRRWKLYIIFLWLKTKEKEEELQVFIIHQRERDTLMVQTDIFLSQSELHFSTISN